MALIRCPECEKEISKSANTCPHCGKPFSKGNKSVKLFLILSGSLFSIFGIISVFFGIKIYCSTSDHFVFANVTKDNVAGAITANNVRSVGEQLCENLGLIMILCGIFLVLFGIIQLICGAIYKIKNKKAA